MAAFISVSTPIFHPMRTITPREKWESLKNDRESSYNKYERVKGFFVDGIPVGLFQFFDENKQIEEETIFIR